MKHNRKMESGQMIVILTVGIVVLLGFAALAIDLGQYYSDRRHDQNAADDASLKGVGSAGSVMGGIISVYNFSCSNDTVITAMSEAEAGAISQAVENGFTIVTKSDYATMADTVDGWVEVLCAPDGGKNLTVEVLITNNVESFFAQLLGRDELNNTVRAVTIIEPGSGLGEGQAIVALNQEECDSPSVSGLVFGGTSDIVINDSGAHSNTCLKCDGGLGIDSEGPIEWNPDSLTDSNCEDGNLIGPGVVTTTDHIIDPPDFDVDCGEDDRPNQGKIKVNNKNDVVTLSPGNYESITQTNGEIILEPGLYCVSDGISVNSGIIRVSGNDDDDDGVTIYSNNTISITGGTAYLRAPRSNWHYSKPASYSHTYPTIPGLLFYLDDAPSNATLTLNGNGDSYFRGTVYYPDGLITINGNSEQVDWLVEVIGFEVNVSGTANTYITYNGDNGHAGFPYISLQK